MSDVAKAAFSDYERSVARALDAIGAAERLPREGRIIIKPNLTNASPPPVTTPPEAVQAVVRYCRRCTQAQIVLGEGCGSGRTDEVFRALGYDALARRLGLRTVDFNEAPAMRVSHPEAQQLREFWLPDEVRDAFLISLPILKDHSMTTTTIALKNLLGLAPGRFYGGTWNKSKLHAPSTHRSIVDVARYKAPDLCVVDAVVALTGSHLSGTPKRLGLILSGFDPVAVDAVGSDLLGHDPRAIEYLRLADEILGSMDHVRLLSAG